MCGVFDDPEITFLCELCKRRRVERSSAKMDGQDRLRPRSDHFSGPRRCEAQTVAVNIDEDRRRANMGDCIDGRDEREGRRDDFVTLAYAECDQRQVKTGRA